MCIGLESELGSGLGLTLKIPPFNQTRVRTKEKGLERRSFLRQWRLGPRSGFGLEGRAFLVTVSCAISHLRLFVLQKRVQFRATADSERGLGLQFEPYRNRRVPCNRSPSRRPQFHLYFLHQKGSPRPLLMVALLTVPPLSHSFFQADSASRGSLGPVHPADHRHRYLARRDGASAANQSLLRTDRSVLEGLESPKNSDLVIRLVDLFLLCGSGFLVPLRL